MLLHHVCDVGVFLVVSMSGALYSAVMIPLLFELSPAVVASRVATVSAGGAAKWRVISLCAGGRHSMLLAMPDSNAIERDDASDDGSDGSSAAGAIGNADDGTAPEDLVTAEAGEGGGTEDGSDSSPTGYTPVSESGNVLRFDTFVNFE